MKKEKEIITDPKRHELKVLIPITFIKTSSKAFCLYSLLRTIIYSCVGDCVSSYGIHLPNTCLFQTSVCRNGGILRNNTCDCAPGYVGQNCELGPMRGTHILLTVCSSSLSKLDCCTSLLSSSSVHLYQLNVI